MTDLCIAYVWIAFDKLTSSPEIIICFIVAATFIVGGIIAFNSPKTWATRI